MFSGIKIMIKQDGFIFIPAPCQECTAKISEEHGLLHKIFQCRLALTAIQQGISLMSGLFGKAPNVQPMENILLGIQDGFMNLKLSIIKKTNLMDGFGLSRLWNL